MSVVWGSWWLLDLLVWVARHPPVRHSPVPPGARQVHASGFAPVAAVARPRAPVAGSIKRCIVL